MTLSDKTASMTEPLSCHGVKTEKAKIRAEHIAPIIRDIIAKSGGGMSFRAVAMVLEAPGIRRPRSRSTWQAVRVQRVLAAAATRCNRVSYGEAARGETAERSSDRLALYSLRGERQETYTQTTVR